MGAAALYLFSRVLYLWFEFQAFSQILANFDYVQFHAGITTEDHLLSKENQIQPSYYISGLGELRHA
jgi:hypothetical protein